MKCQKTVEKKPNFHERNGDVFKLLLLSDLTVQIQKIFHFKRIKTREKQQVLISEMQKKLKKR